MAFRWRKKKKKKKKQSLHKVALDTKLLLDKNDLFIQQIQQQTKPPNRYINPWTMKLQGYIYIDA